MSVVENFQAKQPLADHSIPHDNTEEQIAELNELLIHVLDELADMKRVLQANVPKRQKQRPPSKRHPPSDQESSEEEESDEATKPPTPRRGLNRRRRAYPQPASVVSTSPTASEHTKTLRRRPRKDILDREYR